MTRLHHFPAKAARLLTLAALLLLTLAAGMPSMAQFTGPTPRVNSTLNTPQTVTTDPAVLYPAAREVVLTNGDLLSVRIAGPGDYAAVVRIGADGRVTLPLIGSVELGGLTVSAAEALIASDLVAAQMFVDPQVQVQITEGPNSGISVVGDLHGVIPAVGARRLFDVLAAAGPFPATASHVITIDRPGVADPIVVDLGTDPARSKLANVPVFPGDTIIVSRVGLVYILGDFKTTGVVPLTGNSPLTLLQVSSISGGALYEGKLHELRIIRTVGNKRSLIRVDYSKILKGTAPDPIMQSDDIVYLPPDTLKTLIAEGGINTLFSITSLLISVISLNR